MLMNSNGNLNLRFTSYRLNRISNSELLMPNSGMVTNILVMVHV